MDVPLKNIYTFEALSSKSIKLQTEDDTAADTCLVLPHLPIEDDITSDCESEILLNDDVSSQPNLNMRISEQINDLRTMKIEEMGFHPGHVAMDKGTIKGSTKNFITCKSINNSLNDGIISENSGECNRAYGDENLIENINTKEENYICIFCQKSCYDSSTLKSHLSIHVKEKYRFVCNFCKKSFNSKCYLVRHLNIHTKEKNYVCNLCQKSFNDKSRLNTHIKNHTKEKKYICNFCQKSFNSKCYLERHINIHTKEKKYICNFCQKCFYRSLSLTLHLNMHTKEKTYICNFCQKCFYRNSNLISHLNIHTKEKN
ncbi:uncharacterized protein LOC142333675 [Lycorma delicatula]|uniref:uncharacterized protein LOC142333675 n=1 Tax=Lycorma delicatula TaxID=130591 RepID=UPI003F515D55